MKRESIVVTFIMRASRESDLHDRSAHASMQFAESLLYGDFDAPADQFH